MANINGALIVSPYSRPEVTYRVGVSITRTSDTQCRITVTTEGRLGWPNSWLHDGSAIDSRWIILSQTNTHRIKTNTERWDGNWWQGKKTSSFTINASSGGTINMQFQAYRDGTWNPVSPGAGHTNLLTYQITLPSVPVSCSQCHTTTYTVPCSYNPCTSCHSLCDTASNSCQPYHNYNCVTSCYGHTTYCPSNYDPKNVVKTISGSTACPTYTPCSQCNQTCHSYVSCTQCDKTQHGTGCRQCDQMGYFVDEFYEDYM